MQLVRRLYERGFGRQDILDLFRLIDWQIPLPERWEIDFRREVAELEKEKVMPYVTSIERLGRQEGRQEGRIEAAQEGIQEALSARFGPLPAGLAEDIQAVCDPAQLRQWHRLAVTVASLEIFREAIRERSAVAR